MRIIFLICEKYFGNTANFGSICEVYFANGPKIRRVFEIFFFKFFEKNNSHLRRRSAVAMRRKYEEFGKIRKCDGDAPSQAKTRRKYGENASQTRILRRNLAHLGRICEEFAAANSSQVRRVFDVGSPAQMRRRFAGENASHCEKFASATALRRRRRKRVANTAKTRRKCEF